jgi:hypothetical protein
MKIKKHLIVIIGGASNSSTDKEDKIRTVVMSSLEKNDLYIKDPGMFRIVDLSSFGNRRDINKWFGELNPFDYLSISVFAKSLGGVRLMQAYNKNKHIIDMFERVSLVFVDAHSPIPNYYGAWRGFKIDNKSNGNVIGWNVFQRNKGSEGCNIKFKGTSYHFQEKDKNVNHFNIVSYPIVRIFIQDAIYWAIDGNSINWKA